MIKISNMQNCIPYISFLFCAFGVLSEGAFAQSHEDLARQQLQWQQKRLQVDQLDASQVPVYRPPAPAYQPPVAQYGNHNAPPPPTDSGLYGMGNYNNTPNNNARRVIGEGECRSFEGSFNAGCPNYARQVAEKECGPNDPLKQSYSQLQIRQACVERVTKRVMGVQ